MNYLSFISEYISLIPFVYWIFIYLYFLFQILNLIPVIFSLKYIIGFSTIIVISQSLKNLLYKAFIPVSKRPIGACDCNFLSNNGNKENEPGLPSTHMAIVSYFVTYNILLINKFISKESHILFYFLNILLLVITGWARWFKKCHNITQILAGTLLGTLYGIIIYSL